MAPATMPVTRTVIVPLPALLLLPAVMPLKAPRPLIWLAPTPLELPKLACRSSTKPMAPVAAFFTTSAWSKVCPTCSVPKFNGAV